ncbi:MAG: ATP-binding protein [Gemmatimonas sp.]
MKQQRRTQSQLLLAFAALVVLTALMLAFRDRLDKAHVALLYLLMVLGGSAAGRLAGLTLGVAAFVLFNVFFLPPYNTLVINDPLDWLVLISFLITSVVATELLNRQRVQTELAERRRSELDQFATLGAETLNAARAEHALAAIARVIQSSVGVSRCELFVGNSGKDLRPIAGAAEGSAVLESLPAYVAESGRESLTRRDGTVHVVSEMERPMTEIRDGNVSYSIPLSVRGKTVGVLRVSDDRELTLTSEKLRVLTALAYYAALAMERLRLEGAEEAAEELRRVDRLKDSLLAAVSHDLRTPLTTIRALAHEIATASDGDLFERATVIEGEVDQLSAMVEDLLELSQLNAGTMPVDAGLNTTDELIEAALQRASVALKRHVIRVKYAQEWLLVGRFDFGLTLRILVNLLENAAKYSPVDGAIDIDLCRIGDVLQIAVSDRGPGIAQDDQARIFEPFFRSGNAPPDVRGAGLGLSIAKQLAEVQSGSLRVAARDGGGSTFVLTLPAADVPATGAASNTGP